jgi:chromosomal replication initiation ATPase DnaA
MVISICRLFRILQKRKKSILFQNKHIEFKLNKFDNHINGRVEPHCILNSEEIDFETRVKVYWNYRMNFLNQC